MGWRGLKGGVGAALFPGGKLASPVAPALGIRFGSTVQESPI